MQKTCRKYIEKLMKTVEKSKKTYCKIPCINGKIVKMEKIEINKIN